MISPQVQTLQHLVCPPTKLSTSACTYTFAQVAESYTSSSIPNACSNTGDNLIYLKHGCSSCKPMYLFCPSCELKLNIQSVASRPVIRLLRIDEKTYQENTRTSLELVHRIFTLAMSSWEFPWHNKTNFWQVQIQQRENGMVYDAGPAGGILK